MVHSVQGGYMDKALFYSDKAMQFMSDLDRRRGGYGRMRVHPLIHALFSTMLWPVLTMMWPVLTMHVSCVDCVWPVLPMHVACVDHACGLC